MTSSRRHKGWTVTGLPDTRKPGTVAKILQLGVYALKIGFRTCRTKSVRRVRSARRAREDAIPHRAVCSCRSGAHTHGHIGCARRPGERRSPADELDATTEQPHPSGASQPVRARFAAACVARASRIARSRSGRPAEAAKCPSAGARRGTDVPREWPAPARTRAARSLRAGQRRSGGGHARSTLTHQRAATARRPLARSRPEQADRRRDDRSAPAASRVATSPRRRGAPAGAFACRRSAGRAEARCGGCRPPRVCVLPPHAGTPADDAGP